VRFFAVSPKSNQTSFLYGISGPSFENFVLNVEPSSLVQDAYISNITLILSVAIFFFGIIESVDGGYRVWKALIVQKAAVIPQNNEAGTKQGKTNTK